jgi:hypothetical protein
VTARDVAADHHSDRAKLTAAVGASARKVWQGNGPDRLKSTWPKEAARLAVVVSGAQLVAAKQADPYLTAVLSEQDVGTSARARVRPEALSGVASDGRDLVGLLLQPAVTVAALVAAGQSQEAAFAAGLAALEMMVRTQVADAGRLADQVALTTRPAAEGYTRMTVGVTCARCAILAGRWYAWNEGFLRHPRCDCVHVPSREALASDTRLDPTRLISADRVTGLSKAEREAIDSGSDPSQVVNARRGTYLAGGRTFTREGTTRRGSSPTKIRLTPDQIFIEADGDRAEALRLLRLHGYIR